MTIASQRAKPRSASSTPGCTDVPSGWPLTTSHLVLTQAATLPDSLQLLGGILFIPRGLFYLFGFADRVP
jgi:hypothetical protein